MEALEFHPLANIFPLIEGEDFAALVDDIRANGLHDAIDLYQGKILDGRNRYRAAIAAEIELEKRNFRHFMPELYGDALSYVLSKNLKRRHLSVGQRAYAMAEAEKFRHGGPRQQDANLQIDRTRTELAEAAHVSERTIASAAVIRDRGVEDLKTAVKQGEIAISAAERIARMPEPEQREEVQRVLPNGHRAIMGSRHEPDDSLDYFPTPPWATRALIEHVLRPHLGTETLGWAWEPACGEGHIAEVLREYFVEVAATDIHDYGYSAEPLCDFTGPQVAMPAADWIITNPPFGDKTEEFVLRSLERARVGVAMFVRLQWLESVGRYEAIFRDNPPTIIAFFAERVPLCKGRWDPKGGTATAYIWLVWVRGAKPRAPFWIPPGCREALTRPDDAERFTTQPVTKKDHIICDEPFDAQTGEIAAEPSPIAVIAPEPERHQVSPEPNLDLDIPNFLKIGDPNNFRNAEVKS